jgi:hypothetical protein
LLEQTHFPPPPPVVPPAPGVPDRARIAMRYRVRIAQPALATSEVLPRPLVTLAWALGQLGKLLAIATIVAPVAAFLWSRAG